MGFFSTSFLALLVFTSSAICQVPTTTADDSSKAMPTTLVKETKSAAMSSESTKTNDNSTETESAKTSAKESKTEKIDPTPTKKNASPSCAAVTATGAGGTTIYTQYYSGSGFTENPNNPGNLNLAAFPSFTTTLCVSPHFLSTLGNILTNSSVPNLSSGKDPICTVIQECANSAASDAFGYYSFQVYYLKSQKQYVCVAYANSNTDSSYFNVANKDATAVYGFSGMGAADPWAG